MPRQVVAAIALFFAMGIGLALSVWMLTKTIPVVTRVYEATGAITRRRELLERADQGLITGADVDEIAALTTELRRAMNADHVVAALDAELESVELARMAFRRGDREAAARFLRRVGRTMIESGGWLPEDEA